MLLVDGAHNAKSVLADILAMRQLAARGATLLIDDINGILGVAGPGSALRHAEKDGVVQITSWREYNSSQPENPCLRRVRKPLWNCPKRWGFAIARYAAVDDVRD